MITIRSPSDFGQILVRCEEGDALALKMHVL